jgi:hypothetical protein
MAKCMPPNKTTLYARWEVDPTEVCRDSKKAPLQHMYNTLPYEHITVQLLAPTRNREQQCCCTHDVLGKSQYYLYLLRPAVILQSMPTGAAPSSSEYWHCIWRIMPHTCTARSSG